MKFIIFLLPSIDSNKNATKNKLPYVTMMRFYDTYSHTFYKQL